MRVLRSDVLEHRNPPLVAIKSGNLGTIFRRGEEATGVTGVTKRWCFEALRRAASGNEGVVRLLVKKDAG
jgi:hypothetical protein